MYDVITISINAQLTKESDSLCGQRPIYSLRLFYFFLRRIFGPVHNKMYINLLVFWYVQISTITKKIIARSSSCVLGSSLGI